MKIIIIIYALLSLLLTSCSYNDGNSSYNDTKTDSSGGCPEPENPYNDGGGHDAGFNWAQEKGRTSCDGNSSSFNEGCEEYGEQLIRYQNCSDK